MKLHPLFEDSEYPTYTMLGHVSAGTPIEIGGEFERIDLNYMLTHGNPECMLIRVRGDSMSSEIMDGDWVMIDRGRAAQPGDIVLAELGGGYTLKRYKLNSRDKARKGLYLVPANHLVAEHEVQPDDTLAIIGVVTHIIHPTTKVL